MASRGSGSSSNSGQPWLQYAKLVRASSNPQQNQYICAWPLTGNQSGVCGFAGDTATMHRHVMAVHLPNGAFTCPVCGWTFAQRTFLDAHMATHTTVSGPCPHCGQNFTDSATRYNHLVQQHGYTPNA